MKMSVDWHKECLKNWERSVDRDEERACKLLDSVDEARNKIAILAAQIERAEREGKTSFDSDRYAAKSLDVRNA